MNNGLYHIQDNKVYKMSLNEPMKKIGIVTSDEAIMNIIDTVTEYMYCNYGDCGMKKITWAELQKVRNEIKENAMEMIKANLDSILKRRKSMLSKVREVFTKEYREETEYREFADTMLHHFKLKNTSESIEDKIRRLSDEKFVSNFNIKVGRY